MSDFKIRTIELFPGTPEGEAKCMQGCTHCPAKILAPDYEANNNLAYSNDSMRAAELLSEYFEKHDIHISLMSQGIPLIADIKGLQLERQPLAVNFNLQQPGSTDSEDKIIGQSLETAAKFKRLLPGLKEQPPGALAISIVPKLDEYGFLLDIDKISIAFRTAVESLLQDNLKPGVSLALNLGVNRTTPKQYQYMSGGSTVIKQLQGVFGNVFKTNNGETIPRESIIPTIHSQADLTAVSVNFKTEDGPEYVVRSRIIKYQPETQFTELAEIEQGISIGLNPDHVWIGHSTLNIKDKSLRMNYPTFFTLLAEAEKNGIDLYLLLANHVRSQRNQNSTLSTSHS